MTALYTITLRHPDGRALYALPRPTGWRPEWDGLLTAFQEQAGTFGEQAMREWMAGCKALGNGFRAQVRVASGERRDGGEQDGGSGVTEKRGYEIAAEAFEAFDAWLAAQPDEVQELSILEQIDLYAEERP